MLAGHHLLGAAGRWPTSSGSNVVAKEPIDAAAGMAAEDVGQFDRL